MEKGNDDHQEVTSSLPPTVGYNTLQAADLYPTLPLQLLHLYIDSIAFNYHISSDLYTRGAFHLRPKFFL